MKNRGNSEKQLMRLCARWAAKFSFLALFSGCGDLIVKDLNIPGGDVFSWRDPAVTDRGVFGPSFVSFSGNKTFSDYVVVGGPDGALLTGGFHDGSLFRGMGRIYTRVVGWGSSGQLFQFIDAGVPTANIYNVASGVDSLNQFLAVVSDGGTVASDNSVTQSVGFAGLWINSIRPLTQPSAAYPLDLNTNPVTYGRSSSIVYDVPLGTFFYGFIDEDTTASPDNNLYVNSYNGAWGSSGTETLLAAGATQVESVSDIYGTHFVWLTEAAETPALGMGTSHACALGNDSAVRCWGTNTSGQLGDGTTGTSSVPHDALGLDVISGDKVTSIDAGGNASCAVLGDGSIDCWGNDASGQVGDSNVCSTAAGATYCSTPTTVAGLTGDAVEKVSVGLSHVCATMDVANNGFSCWGSGASGQLGDGTFVSATAPITTTFGGNYYTDIAAGGSHTCAAENAGSIWCWGANGQGQLGDAQACSAVSCNTPQDTGLVANLVTAGTNHSCAYVTAGTVYCWGDNVYGQIGDASTTDRTAPVATGFGTPTSVSALAAGTAHTCAIYSTATVTGGVKCWGDNENGQLGIGTTSGPETCATHDCSQSPVPTLIFGSGVTAVALSANGDKTCATTLERGVYCWGDGNPTPSLVSGAVNCATGSCLAAASSTSLSGVFQTRKWLSDPTATVVGFSTASDGNGNTVVVFIQSDTGHSTCLSSATNCQYRVYATLLSADGQVIGPTRIDGDFDDQETTLYQNGGIANEGGLDYFVPQVVFLGGGRFLAVFSVLDGPTLYSGLYSKIFTVGSGWQSSSTLVDGGTLTTSGTQHYYRLFNDIKLVSGHQNIAILLAHRITTDGATVANRSYGYRTYRWKGANWLTGKTLDGAYACAADQVGGNCLNPRMQGHQFPTGEGFFVFPAPTSSGSSNYQLWSIEYR